MQSLYVQHMVKKYEIITLGGFNHISCFKEIMTQNSFCLIAEHFDFVKKGSVVFFPVVNSNEVKKKRH